MCNLNKLLHHNIIKDTKMNGKLRSETNKLMSEGVKLIDNVVMPHRRYSVSISNCSHHLR